MPSLTSVKASVTEELVLLTTARSVTALGFVVTVVSSARTVSRARVEPVVTLESGPNTAFRFSVSRNATSSNPYCVAGAKPSTVHVRCSPITPAATGVVHVPLPTLVALCQWSWPGAKRMS